MASLAPGEQAPATEEKCNTHSCDSFVWVPQQWKACSNAVCGGVKTRELKCLNAKTNNEAPESSCPSIKPATAEPCEPCPFCSDRSRNLDCSGRGARLPLHSACPQPRRPVTDTPQRAGECTNDQCVCQPPFGGPTCKVDIAKCPSAVLDEGNNCCSSGVLDKNRECCPASNGIKPRIDNDGECCAGELDACGVCNGLAKYVDAEMVCCKVRELPPLVCLSQRACPPADPAPRRTC